MSQFFKDNDGHLSMMRLCVFLIVVTACAVACIDGKNNVILISTMLTIALSGKAVQRFKE